MPIFGVGGGQVTGGGGGSSQIVKQNPTITKQLLTLADTEYIINLPANRVSYLIRARESSILKVASATGNIATGDYFTVPYGNSIFADNVDAAASISLYFSSSKPNTTIEIWCWT